MILTGDEKTSAGPSRSTAINQSRTPSVSSMNVTHEYSNLPHNHDTSPSHASSIEDNAFLPEYTRRKYSSRGYTSHPAIYNNSNWNRSSVSDAVPYISSVRIVEKPLPELPSQGQISLNDADARLQGDGRLEITFGKRFSRKLPDNYGASVDEIGIDLAGFKDAPKMSINIMIVGSRGDVQPYLALGQKLQQYGHTVRLATHETFRQLVKDNGLRFFNIGGDPHELMSYMVRNPGLIPGFESLKNGDIGKKQKMVGEILERCFLSCLNPDDEQDGGEPFAADAIISNPPTFAHMHCAEALGIPLLLSFTMPWCATAAFPHPLVNIKQSVKGEPKMMNYFSYGLVDIMTWQGLGRTINKFRMRRLGLPYLNTQSAVGMIERCGVPWTYCLSPALVQKPEDWMSHIDVVGFYFLDLAKGYNPPKDLIEFLQAGEPPIYIGFGSIVLDNPQQITKFVLAAVTLAGVRAIISPGWGGLDKDMIEAAGPHVFALGNVPHDWLFERVSAVCHHGGAGTTAIGLRCGKPTIIVPFFGDQPWWAAQIARRGAGPPPIYPKTLTAESLASAIRIALSPNTLEAATAVGEIIKQEDGVHNGVESFHKHMPLLNMRCDLDPSRVAVWYSPKLKLRLSAFAAQVLAECEKLDINKLELHRSREYESQVAASDILTGTISTSFQFLNTLGRGVAQLPTSRPDKGLKKIVEAYTLGSQTILQGMAEGLHNTPNLYGGEVRDLGKVNGLGSGLVAGGKGLMFGMYDGVTDIFRLPAKGYKENGAVGAIAGVAIGATNTLIKPLAGVVDCVSLPIEGGVKEVRSLFRKRIGGERRATRYREGIVASREGSVEARELIMAAYTTHRDRRPVSNRKGKSKEIVS